MRVALRGGRVVEQPADRDHRVGELAASPQAIVLTAASAYRAGARRRSAPPHRVAIQT